MSPSRSKTYLPHFCCVYVSFCHLFLLCCLAWHYNSQLVCFTVYKKHYPPALNDEVWRLEKIGKDGSFHKRLTKSGIYTVEDFLRLVVRDSPKLRTVRISDLLC